MGPANARIDHDVPAWTVRDGTFTLAAPIDYETAPDLPGGGKGYQFTVKVTDGIAVDQAKVTIKEKDIRAAYIAALQRHEDKARYRRGETLLRRFVFMADFDIRHLVGVGHRLHPVRDKAVIEEVLNQEVADESQRTQLYDIIFPPRTPKESHRKRCARLGGIASAVTP